MITFTDAKYLKHSGNEIDVKVTIRIIDGFPTIYIRDHELSDFKQALRLLQRIALEELTPKA